MPHTLPDLLGALTTEPGRPRLTWYGGGGERIELSGAVLVNWVSKTTNLLVEEFDAEPGTVVATDLPPHWRTLVWALATWRAGAHLHVVDVATAGAADPPHAHADVVVTAAPHRWTTPDGARPRGTELVAVALPGLARTFDGDLPPGGIDAAAGVMTYGDQIGFTAPRQGSTAALSWDTAEHEPVSHDQLTAWAASASQGGAVQVDSVQGDPATGGAAQAVVATAPGARVLLTTPDPVTGQPHPTVVGLLAAALDVWGAGGSVVLADAPTSRELEGSPERLERLVATERITEVR